MASINDTGSIRKRVGRKRKPALAPGPSIQFVNASHPDEFKSSDTMRNVRSHVMYQHRERQDSSPSNRPESVNERRLSTKRTTSPIRTPSDVVAGHRSLSPTPTPYFRGSSWDGSPCTSHTPSTITESFQTLVNRIISATATAPVQSAPPSFAGTFEHHFTTNHVLAVNDLDELKRQYISINRTTFFCQELSWMQRICNNHLLLLTHISAACSFQDLADGALSDSEFTFEVKSKAVSMLASRLYTEDHEVIIMSILHVLVSEIGNINKKGFEVHRQGLIDASSDLQISPRLATYMVILLLTSACVRDQTEPVIPQSIQYRTSVFANDNRLFSPLHGAPQDTSSQYRVTPDRTIQLLRDINTCTNLYLSRGIAAKNPWPLLNKYPSTHDVQLRQIYAQLIALPSSEGESFPDWIYESCRLAALIYCYPIIHSSTLVDAGRILRTQSTDLSTNSVTLLSALHGALSQTDTSDCWGDELRGTFLWVCLVGAAAAWSPSGQDSQALGQEVSSTSAWARKCFTLYAIRAVVSVSDEDADAAIDALQTMLRVHKQIATNAEM